MRNEYVLVHDSRVHLLGHVRLLKGLRQEHLVDGHRVVRSERRSIDLRHCKIWVKLGSMNGTMMGTMMMVIHVWRVMCVQVPALKLAGIELNRPIFLGAMLVLELSVVSCKQAGLRQQIGRGVWKEIKVRDRLILFVLLCRRLAWLFFGFFLLSLEPLICIKLLNLLDSQLFRGADFLP